MYIGGIQISAWWLRYSLSHCRKSRLGSTVQRGSFSTTQSGSYITVSSTMEVWYTHCDNCSHRLGIVLIRAHRWLTLLCVHVHVLVPDEKCTSMYMHIADTHACAYQSPSPGSPQHGWWGLAGILAKLNAVGDYLAKHVYRPAFLWFIDCSCS